MTDTTKPKFIAPYTCPTCGSERLEGRGSTDNHEGVGYHCKCCNCGTEYTHWEKIDYTCDCVEVDGEKFPYEQDEPIPVTLDSAERTSPTNPGLQAALAAYNCLKCACNETVCALRQHLDGAVERPDWKWQLDRVVKDLARAAELVDRYTVRCASDEAVLDNLVQEMERPCSESCEPR